MRMLSVLVTVLLFHAASAIIDEVLPPETFTVNLTEVAFQISGTSEVVTINEQGEGMICAVIRTIEDDDTTVPPVPITLNFILNPYGEQNTASKFTPSINTTDCTISSCSLLVVLGTDFILSGTSVTFPVGSAAGVSMCVTVSGIPDTLIEGPERSAVNIAPNSDAVSSFVVSGGVTGFSEFITLIISDDNSKSTKFIGHVVTVLHLFVPQLQHFNS